MVDPGILLGGVVGVVVLSALAALNIRHRRLIRDGDWHEDASRYRMRRMLPNGRWEYRKMTCEEEKARWEGWII